jgi:hypothetical protein
MLMDSDCDGCVWTYPSNGLVMVSGLESERSNIYTAPFTSQAWYAIAMMITFILSISVMEWMRDGWISTPRHPDADSQHASLSWSPCISIHSVYRTRHMLHLLIALYTANLTSAVLQEKSFDRKQCEKKVIVSQLPFSVGGRARLTDGVRVPGDTHDGFSRSRRGGSTIPWHRAEGLRLVAKSCDPLVSVSGAINRIPYSGHQGRYGRRS